MTEEKANSWDTFSTKPYLKTLRLLKKEESIRHHILDVPPWHDAVLPPLGNPDMQRTPATDLACEICKINTAYFEMLPMSLRTCEAFIERLVWCNAIHLSRVPPQVFLGNRSFAVQVVAQSGPWAMKYMPWTFGNDELFALECIHHPQSRGDRWTSITLELPEFWKDNENIMLALIGRDGDYLSHASYRIKGMKHIAIVAVNSSPVALLRVSDHLRGDYDLCVSAMSHSLFMVDHMPPYILDDFPLMLKVLRGSGSARRWPDVIPHLSQRIRSNADCMTDLLTDSNNDEVIACAHPTLLDNEDFMRRVVTIIATCFKYASTRLQHDLPFIRFCIGVAGNALNQLRFPNGIIDDEEEMLALMRLCPNTTKMATERLWQSSSAVVCLALEHGMGRHQIPFNLRDDYEVCKVVAKDTTHFMPTHRSHCDSMVAQVKVTHMWMALTSSKGKVPENLLPCQDLIWTIWTELI